MIFEAASLCHDSRWPYGQTIPAKPSLILRKEALELAISYAQECFRVTQSLADVADQKVIREDAESLLASVRYNSGHILKIPLHPGSSSRCRRAGANDASSDFFLPQPAQHVVQA